MRPFVRNLLSWLLAALTLLSSASAQRRTVCGAEGIGGCEPQASCCCPQEEAIVEQANESCCSCETPERAPLPMPDHDPGKQQLAIVGELARAPPAAAHDVQQNACAFHAVPQQRSHAPLPARTRQVVYSVWRL